MTAKFVLPVPLTTTVYFAICCCVFALWSGLSLRAQALEVDSRNPFHVELQDEQGAVVAGAEPSVSSKSTSAALAFDREYRPGYRIVFSGPQRMALRMDESIPECFLYNPGSLQEKIVYEIPYGRAEAQTGSAYSPESFAGKSHRVTLRTLTEDEIKSYRNLALNPCDWLQPIGKPLQFFPHASSNSVSRNLFDFEARNAIDGVTQNGHHGVWPYQSWGPQLRTDIWWKVEFGRPVEVDKVRLMVRADFPHDSYWKNLDVEFSDGSKVPLQIGSSAAFQDFSFPKRNVSWLRITNVVPEDAAKWCALMELEAWGRDIP